MFEDSNVDFSWVSFGSSGMLSMVLDSWVFNRAVSSEM